ncbi:hypothetical protein AB0K18_37035 [Nonomuraea sp. NPDC049421]|uniref:hypothetical protein n=1 Tax=Nonomuraea sp. NPDC049421 TaxID=3155275 RepID=UPI00343531C2
MIDDYGIADQTSRHTDHERTNKERSGVVNSISGEKLGQYLDTGNHICVWSRHEGRQRETAR